MSDTRNSINKSTSNTSINESHETPKDSPTKKKGERNALSQRLTKMNLFGRMLRGKDSPTTNGISRDQLNDYLQHDNTTTSPFSSSISLTDHDDASICEDDGILWEEDGNVKAATPFMLVKRITDEKFVDSNLVTDVISSYRSFTTPNEFLELLTQRFEVSSPISLRVCAVLKTWIERQWSDFDTPLADTLVSFIKDVVNSKDILKNVGDQLMKIVSKKMSNVEQRTASLSNPPNPPKPLLPLAVDEIDDLGTLRTHNLTDFGPDVTFWSFPSKELARQLTIVEQKLYIKIQVRELIAQVWAKSDADKKAPNVLSLINHFNKVSAWACNEIVSTQDLQQRIEKLLQLIDVAQHFFAMNNFNGLMAVLAGLHSSSVHRLRRTWAGVPDKSKETFEYLTEFMSSAKNYTQYREHLLKASLPVLPYLGVYLSDLTFIEDGNPGEIGSLVNFSKCRQLAGVIRKIFDFQLTPYTLVSVPFVQNYFNNFTPMDDKMTYDHSTKLEPRAQSTHQTTLSSVNSATVAAAAAAAALTSSIGIDKDFELIDSTELGDSDQFVDSMHARFRKDLIRSRNNSLNNVGEPFPVKVQLPGSLPVEMRMPPNTTSRQAVKHFADFFSGLTEQYCLVIMPCRTDAKGYVFTNDKIVKEVMIAREKDNANMKLALFASPLVVSCALLSGTILGDSKDILVDMGAPLFSLSALFHDILLTNEEFAYLAFDQKNKKAWWMSMHKSLEANHFEKPACVLVIFPLSNFLQRNMESMAGMDKQGVLLAGGREGTLKVTTMRQLWAVLSGPFLLCYKTKNEAAPSEVIALERFSIQPSSAKHVSILMDRNPIFPTSGNAKSHYSLSAETDSETRVWLRTFQRNRGLLGDKVIFGEELDRCAKLHIPVVLQKIVNFINSHALQLDGLFKPPTNSSLVQHYKNQFDQGVEVEFARTNDACTVAQLLLLYFDELPIPLLTYELFPRFMEFGLKPPHPDEEANVLREIVSNLSHPHMTVLAYLLAFLSQVSIENPIKTGIANIFGPCLMRAPPLESEPKNYKDASKVVLGRLIKHREKIFMGISRRYSENHVMAEEAKPHPIGSNSNSPDNNNPLCKEYAALIGKQLLDSAAIAKKVEMLKSQLENKYKATQLKRQVSFHDDSQTPPKPNHYAKNSPAFRNHKSVSFVTRPTFNEQHGVCEYDEESLSSSPSLAHSQPLPQSQPQLQSPSHSPNIHSHSHSYSQSQPHLQPHSQP